MPHRLATAAPRRRASAGRPWHRWRWCRRSAVTKYLTNLVKAPARSEHLGRCGVPETVSTDRRQSCPFTGMPDDCRDTLARKPTMRGAAPV